MQKGSSKPFRRFLGAFLVNNSSVGVAFDYPWNLLQLTIVVARYTIISKIFPPKADFQEPGLLSVGRTQLRTLHLTPTHNPDAEVVFVHFCLLFEWVLVNDSHIWWTQKSGVEVTLSHSHKTMCSLEGDEHDVGKILDGGWWFSEIRTFSSLPNWQIQNQIRTHFERVWSYQRFIVCFNSTLRWL